MSQLDYDEEEALELDDPRVPDAIRDHAARFHDPVKFVVPLGGDEYLLAAEDGEVIDLVYLEH